MRALTGWTLAIAVAIGCGKKTETAPGAGSGSAPPPPAAPADAAAAPPANDFDTHMKAGEALEDGRKFSDALVEFELAAKAKPDDARVLNEISFTAHFAGNDDRAREAAVAAAAVAKADKKLHAQALFNLGLAVEKTQPYAAAQLYMASLVDRPHRGVTTRLASLVKNKASAEQSKPALAILSSVGVKPTSGVGSASAAPASSATPADQELMAALEKAGVEWESGAGKSVLFVENLECRENHQAKQASYDCTSPAVKGDGAKAIIAALGTRKIDPVKDHGDISTWRLASIRCRSFNEGDSGQPDVCEITP